MANPKYIQLYGDQIMLYSDDGTKLLFYKSNSIWLPNKGSGSDGGGLQITNNPPSSITANDTDGTAYTFGATQILRMIQVLQTAIPISGINRDALVVVFITAITESDFKNLSNVTAYPDSGGYPNIDGDGSDGSSLGLYQQTPPNGWGTPEQLCTVSYATQAFIGGPSGPNHGSPAGLLDITPPWNDPSRTPGQAAQAVQGSAFPDRYDKVVPVAQACLNALLTPNSGTGQFSWPFNTNTVTSEYGPRTGPIGSFHEGIDFGYNPAVTGAKEYAAGSGVVEATNLNSNYGYSVQIKHGVDSTGNGLHTIYAHMNSNPIVSAGQKVSKGQLLGYLGASGDATGPHLHWETHTCPSDGPIVHNTTDTSSGLAIRTAINPRDFMTTYGDGAVFPQ